MTSLRSHKPAAGKIAGASFAALFSAYLYKVAKFRRASGKTVEISEPPQPGDSEFARLIEGLTQSPQRAGNRVTILRNGREIFPALIEGINSAVETISFSSYIWWAGGASSDIGDALASRAREGVTVRVLLDAWGSAKLDRALVDKLERAGVEVIWFRPIKWHQIGRANNRMHRRILVMDGTVAFAGGVGIAEEWEGDCEDPNHWRETHVRVEGPAVRDLVGGFVENWAEATGKVPDPSLFPELKPFSDGVPVLVVRSASSEGSSAADNLFLAAIAGSREVLWITTAYFAPHSAYVDALCAAAQRGVDVRILVNGKPIDKQVVRWAGQRSYGRLLKAGVRIFEYQKARLHAKVILVDENWANVGSANFDNRSFALEEEINVGIEDSAVAALLKEHFAQDLVDATEIDLNGWKHRPLSQRVKELASELVRQSL